ncbi:uncharacterized protein N7479_004771 [Penicillium vulpinum]|uniref:uncharacterized protein n=1 Tax=Penicillium vulpinum TaxID=29845 RepID=UPI002546F7E1|nr:uncharacterized protein N7479_004771 [Penicillium vulpinum]KAJ5964895.1 hypothetical protein N7479_004771 [Penicillium vulpinum]
MPLPRRSKNNSDRGNRTPGCRVRDGDVSHYTISDIGWKMTHTLTLSTKFNAVGLLHSCEAFLPLARITETARILSLLIPRSNLKCQRWIQKCHRKATIDLEAGQLRPTSRDTASFSFWSRQLLELREEYERTEPTTLRQWVVDKRKPNQSVTLSTDNID